MKRMLAIGCLCCGWIATGSAIAQTAESPPTGNASAQSNASPLPIYRDPHTGQLYQPELQTVDQPVTKWQRKLVNQNGCNSSNRGREPASAADILCGQDRVRTANETQGLVESVGPTHLCL